MAVEETGQNGTSRVEGGAGAVAERRGLTDGGDLAAVDLHKTVLDHLSADAGKHTAT